jgi:hypothetical protein
VNQPEPLGPPRIYIYIPSGPRVMGIIAKLITWKPSCTYLNLSSRYISVQFRQKKWMSSWYYGWVNSKKLKNANWNFLMISKSRKEWSKIK